MWRKSKERERNRKSVMVSKDRREEKNVEVSTESEWEGGKSVGGRRERDRDECGGVSRKRGEVGRGG